MKRVGSIIKVRPEYEERYCILHKHTFPGVVDRIAKSKIRNYSIFLFDGILFSYYEYVGTEYERDMKALADPTTREWWKLTDPMQEPLPTRKEGEWWAEMEPLLCFDKLLKPSGETRRVGLTAAVRIGKENELNNLYKNIPPDVEVESGRYNFQNCQMYFKDEKVFCYYEYCGKDFQYDWSEVSKNEAVKSFRMNLCECLIGREGRYWQEMEEVFYNR